MKINIRNSRNLGTTVTDSFGVSTNNAYNQEYMMDSNIVSIEYSAFREMMDKHKTRADWQAYINSITP